MEQNLELLADAETWDNGKPIRETMAADMPLAIDHFRYFAGCIRAQEGAHRRDRPRHRRLPLPRAARRGRPDHPVELPAPDGVLEARAGAGRRQLRRAQAGRADAGLASWCWAELIGDLLPPGVLNIVNGFGLEAGKPLASSQRIAKIAFTGETTTGRLIMQYASQNLIPVTLELGGKSPNIFFDDVIAEDDDFFDKAIEGFAMFALNQGEVCTCPCRALIQEIDLRPFMERALKRVEAIKQGNPLDPATMIGAQASSEQLEKILSYLDIGKQEGAEGADRRRAQRARRRSGRRLLRQADRLQGPQQDAHLPGGDLRAGRLGDDVQGRRRSAGDRQRHALRPGRRRVDPRRQPRYRIGRAIQAGRVWTNCYHAYPAHAAFGGYKQSGIGRETHKMMLDHYQQTKNLLVSYSPKKLGFF